MSDQEIARDVHWEVITHFIWTPDQEVYGRSDDWRPQVEVVKADEIIRDDCDCFAMTTMQMCAEGGIMLQKLRLILCHVPDGPDTSGYEMHASMFLNEPEIWRGDFRAPNINHMVGGVDCDGGTLILDNRFRRPWWWTP